MNNSLAGCVASLKSSMSLLDSSISILDSGVHDFPRLGKVLQTTRVCRKSRHIPTAYTWGLILLTNVPQHFELVAESSLLTAQKSLQDEIRPEVEHLLRRVDAYLGKLERREQSLIAKCELQEGRLSQQGRASSSRKPTAKSDPGRRTTLFPGGNAERLRALRQKKERLGYAVDRLNLQAQQKVSSHDLEQRCGASGQMLIF
jgi:DASH complex subunit SPC19